MENPNVIEVSSPKKYFFVKYLLVFILALALSVFMWTGIGVFQTIVFIVSMFIIQHTFSWFRRCYRVEFQENSLVFSYKFIVWSRQVEIPYSKMDAVYGNYVRNLRKNHVKFVYKKQYATMFNLGIITNLSSGHGWSASDLAKIVDMITLHDEMVLRRVEMK